LISRPLRDERNEAEGSISSCSRQRRFHAEHTLLSPCVTQLRENRRSLSPTTVPRRTCSPLSPVPELGLPESSALPFLGMHSPPLHSRVIIVHYKHRIHGVQSSSASDATMTPTRNPTADSGAHSNTRLVILLPDGVVLQCFLSPSIVRSVRSLALHF
jgi:hypothetical protein